MLRPTEFAVPALGGLELRTQYPGVRFELKLNDAERDGPYRMATGSFDSVSE